MVLKCIKSKIDQVTIILEFSHDLRELYRAPLTVLLSFYRVIFCNYSKASGLLIIFGCIIMGHTHFPNNKITITWVPKETSTVFIGCRMPEMLTKKAGLEVLLCLIFNLRKKPVELTCV